MINLSRRDLAINGGNPVRSDPWLDNFTLGEEERLAVSRVFDSGYLSKFEGSHTPDLPFSFYRLFQSSLDCLALEPEPE